MKRAFVLGLGSSGLAAARLLAAEGVIPFVADDRGISDAAAGQLPPESVIVEPSDFARALDDIDEVVVSPGVPSTHSLITAARARHKRVVSELELASRSLRVPLLAVTGTNGKSTTVALLGSIVEASGRRTFTGGNLGRPLSLAAFENPEVCVVEVSSFQLEWVETFHPSVAGVLNVSPDHLDRHGDMESYVRTKLRLFERMTEDDAIVLAHDQAWWRRYAGSWVARLSTFGPWPAPVSGREASGYERGERVVRTTSGQIFALADAWPRAPHDFANAAAAVELARRAEVEQSAIERALSGFRPLPHRLDLVAVYAGVAYWNDSKATNVGAALASLEAFDQPVILMAGGVAKGADLGLLREGIAKLKTVVAYGEAAPTIEAALADDVPVIRASGFDAAFDAARSAAVRGDVVLLAPACASFDEFSGYEARGRRFCELVEALRRGGSGGKG